MSHLISVDRNGSLIRITVTEQLNLEGYKHIVPYVDGAIDEFGSARVIFDLREYDGWNDKARWEDLDLDLPHWARVERVAIVGAEKYEARAPTLCRPFTAATVRYFYPPDAKAAEEWIHESL